MPRLPVDDPDDPLVAEFVGLREKPLSRGRRPADPSCPSRARRTAGVFVAEGDVVVARALAAGYRLRSVLVDATRRAPLPDAVPDGAVVYAASPRSSSGSPGSASTAASSPASTAGRCRPPPRCWPAARRVVVLENGSNPTNLGVILRTARGLGIDAALLDPTCTDPLYRRVSRVAMGEGYALPYARSAACPTGWRRCATPASGSVALTPGAGAVPLDTLPFAPRSGWPCCSAPRGRGCRPRRWRPPTCERPSPCRAASTPSTSAWPPASPAGW